MYMVKKYLKKGMLPIQNVYLVFNFMVYKGIVVALEDYKRG
jgi:hypothetical protein